MPTTRIYTSTMTGAPVLTGLAGEFVNLLDKTLVTGWGSGPGAIAPAGWSKDFTGTNKAVFRAGGGNRMFLRVEDHFLTGSTRYAKLRGAIVASAVDTLVEPFPDPSQVTDGCVLQYNVGAVARPWKVFADDRTVYVFTSHDGTGTYWGFKFGDFFSYVLGDLYRTVIAGPVDFTGDSLCSIRTSNLTILLGHYVARKYTGAIGSLNVGKHGDSSVLVGELNKGVTPFPDPISGGILLAPIYLHEIAEPTTRGKFRGFWYWPHVLSGVGDGDTFTGAAGTILEGRSFTVVAAKAAGLYIMETSSTWVTSS